MRYNELTVAVQGPVFTRNDLALLGHKVLDYQFSLWVKKGYLMRLKKGVYAFSRDRDKLRGEGIAFLLYQPSYLSLESALAWYGFIPEIVYAYTSVSARITRTFENAFGHFIYRHVKSELFWGYVEVKTDQGPYLLAEPEKALLDYFYLNLARINTEDDFDSIRLNEEEMGRSLNKDKFMRYLNAFGVKKMEKWARRCLP
jgi:hypothetical protein